MNRHSHYSYCCRLLAVLLCCRLACTLKCSRNSEEGRNARIDALKRELLFKLQMLAAPPNVTAGVYPVSAEALAEYNAIVAAQNQRNRDLRQCAQFDKSSRELFVFFPAPLPAPTRRRRDISVVSGSYSREAVSFNVNFGNKAVSSAELRLYKIKNPDSNSSKPEPVVIFHSFRQDGSTYDIQTYVTSKYVSADNDGYEAFNVTNALLEWIGLPRDLGTNPLVGTFTLKVLIGQIGQNRIPSVTFKYDSSDNDTSTQLVVACYEASRRQKREATAINSTACLINPNYTTCCLRSLVVDFHRDLGYNWIIQPTTYALNYCSGLCPWNIPQATQGSLFQAILNANNPMASPQPCCAPDIFTPLTMLFLSYDVRNPSNPPTTQTRIISNLAVQQCICR